MVYIDAKGRVNARETDKRAKVGRQKRERVREREHRALAEGALSRPPALSGRSPEMPEIEQSPSRFLLPRTSSIHPTPVPPVVQLPPCLPLSNTSGVWVPMAPRRRPSLSPSSTSSSSLSGRKLWQRRRNLAGIDNHGDGAVLARFSPPKPASFARKHPRRAWPLLHPLPSTLRLFLLLFSTSFSSLSSRSPNAVYGSGERTATYVGITAAPTGDFIPPSVNSWESSSKHRRSRPESFEIR